MAIVSRSAAILRLIFSDKGWGEFWDLLVVAHLWEGLGGKD
jgi:hypothetical protein